MRLPQDVVVPSLRSGGRSTSGRNANPGAGGHRRFVWIAPPVQPPGDNEAPGSPWKPRKEGFHPAIPLPGLGLAKLGGEAEPSVTLACSNGSLRAANFQKDDEALPSKVWMQAADGRGATTGTLFCSTPCHGVAGLATPPACLARDAFSSSGKVSSRRSITLPMVRETSLSTGVVSPRELWDSSPRSDQEMSRTPPWSAEDHHHQNPDMLKRRVRSTNPDGLKPSRRARHNNAADSNGPGAASKLQKGSKIDVSMSHPMYDSGSDDEDHSEEDDEGRPLMTEKRRRRMLSNRASAQRSRLRRQERLDTLEVLVAELRVENASLARKANIAGAAAKRLEDENKRLLEEVATLNGSPSSDTVSLNELSYKRVEQSVDNPHSVLSSRYPEENHFDRNDTGESLSSSKSNLGDEPMEQPKHLQPQQSWSTYMLNGNFDFDFG